MPTIDEKRVYTDNTGTETVYLATGLGVVGVSVSDDLIGEFGVVRRCHARDVATDGPLVAAATDEDVLLADRAAIEDEDEPVAELDFTVTGFGPATAVGFDDGALLAGDEDGGVARLDAAAVANVVAADATTESDATPEKSADESAWTALGSTDGVRAIDGGLVAAADGVYRAGDTGLTHAGLDDAHDVDSEPLVATASGLYKLGNGWMDVLPGPVEAVAAAGSRAHAASDGDLYARSGGSWSAEEFPVEEDIVAVTHGAEASYAVTAGGTIGVRLSGDEWRYRGLGVGDVAAATV
ncbi:HVO_0234 family beta-propeller protein [Halobellus marinus]|uniref:HVO_0234 family beta-propeller protein n=1 Tax=Halobellus TaxID=1073986 RepID=UPI0028A72CC3|nr:hypothetical protein [Halobellus sp. DFY28]